VVNQANSIGELQRKTMSILLIACSLLWSKSFTPERLALTLRLVIEAVARVHKHFPLTEMDIKLHNLMHLVHKITVSGPLWVTSMFGYEGMWKRFGEWGKNKSDVEVTMLRKYSDYEYMCWRYLADPSKFSANVEKRFPLLGSDHVKNFWFAEAGMPPSIDAQLLGKGEERLLLRDRKGAKANDMLLNLHLHYSRYAFIPHSVICAL
jgi:hypothetical protein